MENGVDHHHRLSDDDAILSPGKPQLTQTISAITITPEQFEKVR